MSLLTFYSSAIFFVLGFVPCYFFGFTVGQCAIIGVITMFSSTIIGLKLLPTTILHHQHTGELLISILLLQDIIAIGVLLGIEAFAGQGDSFANIAFVLSAFPVLLLVAYFFQRYVLAKLLERFDKIHEYIFILSIGWCLCMARLSSAFGLSEEIGAFIGGVALASSPIAFYIAESLKPLRDFFLVIFFFTIGATFNFSYFDDVFLHALTLAALVLLVKPYVFSWLLRRSGEVKATSWEIGVRLGQLSEFSLLVIYMALDTNLLPPDITYMAQAAVILTFIGSCYWTVLRYPTPLASTDRLRRD